MPIDKRHFGNTTPSHMSLPPLRTGGSLKAVPVHSMPVNYGAEDTISRRSDDGGDDTTRQRSDADDTTSRRADDTESGPADDGADDKKRKQADENDNSDTEEQGNNKIAAKKSIAHGMLDVALLTANASHLKYVLKVGAVLEFYTLMIWLLGISISLQVVTGVLLPIQNLMKSVKVTDDTRIYWDKCFHYFSLTGVLFVTVLNVMISAFDVRPTGDPSGVVNATTQLFVE